MDSLQPQPQYFHSSRAVDLPRTFLELEDDKKFVSIYHPLHGRHRFPLPTKDEISKDYSNSNLNSFFIFRTYLHKSNNYLDLEEISTIASAAWEYATEDVLEACRELETELKKNVKYKRFVSYSPPTQKSKRPKKNKSPSKKKRSTYLYPSPPMAATPITPTAGSDSSLYSPYTPASPMCMSGAQYAMPPLMIEPPRIPLPKEPKQTSTSMLSDNSNTVVQSSSASPRLTPSQIFFYTHSLGSELTSAIPCSSSSNLEGELSDKSGLTDLDLNNTSTTMNLLSPEDEKICINELFEDQISEMRSPML